MKRGPSFPEEVLKGGNINSLRADTAAVAVGPAPPGELAFGPFVFDRASRLLARDGVEVPLPPRVLGVLALLLDRAGQLVTKQELMSAVWRDAFVTETSLAEAISVLRQTLGDDPQRPSYIQTLHRRGYRFIAEVTVLPAGGGARTDAAATEPPTKVAEDRSVVQPDDQREPEATAGADEPEPRLSLLVPWTVTLFAVLIAGVAVWKYLSAVVPPARPAARFTISLPAGLAVSSSGAPVAISRDGSLIAFAGCRGDECAIYLRPLSQAEPTPVAGTTAGASPFFSPDGRWLGYFANGRIHTIALAGGSPVAVANAPEPLGATWTRDGQIVFAGRADGGLSIVPMNGGPVTSLTRPAAGEGSHRWPDLLRDGSGVVFTVTGGAASGHDYAGVASLDTRTWGRLLDDVSAVRAATIGFLVGQRGPDFVGVAFEDRSDSTAGLPVALAPGLFLGAVPQFAVSANGTLAIARPGATELQVVLDWDGELRRLVPAPQPAVLR